MAIELDAKPPKKTKSKAGHKAGDSYARGHGAYTIQIRQRYSDERTSEGKELAVVMRSLVDDLGGTNEVTAGQQILLSSIRSKIIIIKQIGSYIDEKISILDLKGDLLPCLKHHYSTYTESLRRDIETVYRMAEKKPQKAMDLQAYINKTFGKDNQQ